MISLISIFFEWLMFSYFLICSFIMVKQPKNICSHWEGGFHSRSGMYYHSKNIKYKYNLSKQHSLDETTLDNCKLD